MQRDDLCQDDDEFYTGTGVYVLAEEMLPCQHCANDATKVLRVAGVEHWVCDGCYEQVVAQRREYSGALQALGWQ